jgi:predicted nucleic acid-binding protein
MTELVGDLELPDVNVLVALLHSGHVHHGAAQRWFASAARFATTPITESGLLRVALNPAVTGAAASTPAALA